MKSVATDNQQLLKSLDEEGILLSDYLLMLVEKTLLKQGVIQGIEGNQLLADLD